jgi:hypothetical protein
VQSSFKLLNRMFKERLCEAFLELRIRAHKKHYK